MGAPRRPRPCPWAPLLLLLLGGPARGRASLRLLDHPAPVCAQQGLKCVVKNSTCLDDSWLRLEALTPSPPKNMQVRLHFAHTRHKELLPVLHIDWTLKGDASFQVLKGAELSILQLDTNERLCVKFKFLNKLEHSAWHFNFSHFVVEPGQKYEVTVNHLPKSGPDGDPNHESRSFPVPGCRDPRMRLTTPCMSLGSLWDPNITVELLEPPQLRVHFTLWNESAQYQVLLHSFPRTENRSCYTRTLDVPAPPEEEFHQQTNVTLSLPDSWCCRHEVQLQPFFGSCLNDCLRYSVVLHCPALLDAAEPPADSLPLWAYGLLAGIALLLVGSAVLLIVCTTWRLAGSLQGKSGDTAMSTDVSAPAGLAAPPLKPKKVWIVYSADHPLYVDVVLKFAQFLLTVCGTEVALDLLEEQAISEVGVMAWVGRQKQEMVDSGSKIIILCSRGTRAQWHAMLGREEPSVRRKPAGDLFTAAMNMILPDFKQPACFGTYIVCYFSAISSERDIPELFNITSRYPLMDKLEEVYFRVQDLEMFQPGQMRRVGELSGENYLKSPSGRQLKEAVERFRDWQTQHPDWFERENLCWAENQELQSLDEDVFDKRLLPSGGGIVRQRLLVREPASQDCQRVDLLLGEGRGMARLEAQVQPPGPLAAQALQTLVLPSEQIPPAQATEPIPHVAAGRSLTSRVAVLEPSESCPLLAGSDPSWSCVLHAEDPPLCSTPTAPPSLSEARNLPSFLSQQNGSSQAQALWVSPAAGLKGPPGPCEEEQSDQGYISRSSPQPSEGVLETGEGEGKPPATLSPEDLESLRSLQQQLFFQELQRDSGWASAEPETPPEGEDRACVGIPWLQ